MPDIREVQFHFQQGFDDDQAVVAIDKKRLAHVNGLTTDMRTNLAAMVVLPCPADRAEVVVTVTNRRQAKEESVSFELERDDGPVVRVYRDASGKLAHDVSADLQMPYA